MSRGSSPVPRTVFGLVSDFFTFVRLRLRSRVHLAAENVFLRKQPALYRERQVRPRRADPATRVILVLLARFIDWKPILTVVTPDALMRWHRAGWRLFWRWRSRPRGRPRIPLDLRRLIVEKARANLTWGEERIADELLLKLGIAVSRTVRCYLSRAFPVRCENSAEDGSPKNTRVDAFEEACAREPRPDLRADDPQARTP
jgi:hypothetical protein